MTCPAERHDTRAAYTAGCRCPTARAANTAYARQRKRRTAHAVMGGGPPYQVNVEKARAVLETALAAGWTLRQIEATTNLRRDHLARIKGGTSRPVKNVRWAAYNTLTAVAATPPPNPPGGALIDGTPTHRRIQALIAIGWPKKELARRLGVGRSLQIRTDLVTARTARKVDALYRELAYTPGPSTRARTYAADRGWLSAMHWDDRIDDLTFHPFLTTLDDEPLDEPYSDTPRRKGEVLLENIDWLAADGLSDELIARRLQITTGYIEKLRERVAS